MDHWIHNDLKLVLIEYAITIACIDWKKQKVLLLFLNGWFSIVLLGNWILIGGKLGNIWQVTTSWNFSAFASLSKTWILKNTKPPDFTSVLKNISFIIIFVYKTEICNWVPLNKHIKQNKIESWGSKTYIKSPEHENILYP